MTLTIGVARLALFFTLIYLPYEKGVHHIGVREHSDIGAT